MKRERKAEPLREDEENPVGSFVTVTISMGKTVNLGNYESAKVDVGLSQRGVPKSEVASVMEELQAQVRSELESQVNSINENRRGWPGY